MDTLGRVQKFKDRLSKKKPAKVKKVKPKRNSTYDLNQFEDMKKWLAYYEENKKLKEQIKVRNYNRDKIITRMIVSVFRFLNYFFNCFYKFHII
jgi:hypothetical protein